MQPKRLLAFFTMDTLFLIVLAGVTLIFLIQSYGLNSIAGGLPKVVSWIMLALIAYLLFGKARAWVRAPGAAPAEEEPEETAPPAGKTLPWFITFVLIGLYPVLLMVIGFTAGTFIFLVGVSFLLGLKPLPALAFGVVCTIAMVYLFQNLLQVPLPDGSLFKAIGF